MANKIFTLLFIFFVQCLFSQKIDKSKNELKFNKNSDSYTNENSTRTNENTTETLDFGLVSLVAEGFLYVSYYSVIGNYKSEDHLHNSLSRYPYFDGESGNFVQEGDSILYENKMRFDLENHFLYSSNRLFGNHFKAKFRPFQYFYLQGDYRELWEKNFFTNRFSNLTMFQFNLAYDRIKFKKCNFGWTIGATFIGNEVQKTGFSYGLHADIFAIKNISLNTAFMWSRINGFPVKSFETRGKYHRKNYFFAIGYENLKIATPNYNYVTFGLGIYN